MCWPSDLMTAGPRLTVVIVVLKSVWIDELTRCWGVILGITTGGRRRIGVKGKWMRSETKDPSSCNVPEGKAPRFPPTWDDGCWTQFDHLRCCFVQVIIILLWSCPWMCNLNLHFCVTEIVFFIYFLKTLIYRVWCKAIGIKIIIYLSLILLCNRLRTWNPEKSNCLLHIVICSQYQDRMSV